MISIASVYFAAVLQPQTFNAALNGVNIAFSNAGNSFLEGIVGLINAIIGAMAHSIVSPIENFFTSIFDPILKYLKSLGLILGGMIR